MTAIIILGKPLGQPRQRVAVIAGRARNYTPASHPIQAWKYAIRAAWIYPLIEGPVSLEITAIFPRPKSRIKKRGENPRYPHTGKPDWDNIGKAVADALNGVAYRDDSQVVCGTVRKLVAAGGEHPRTIVEVIAGCRQWVRYGDPQPMAVREIDVED